MNAERSRYGPTVRAARALLVLNALIWLGLGVASFLRIAKLGASSGTLAAMAVLISVNAVAFLVCAMGLGTRRRIFYWLTLAVLAVNIVLTFTDQFGAPDLITLLIDLVIVGLLVYARAWWTTASR